MTITRGPAYVLGLFLFIICVAGCSVLSSPEDIAASIAKPAGFQAAVLSSSPFQLKVFRRYNSQSVATLRIYIEGDGRAWKGKFHPPSDPTPLNPMGLKLAVKDTSAAVLYIARPCQYVADASCDIRYWTTDRYADAVIKSMNQAISAEMKKLGASQLEITGYSGGAAVAMMMAAQRDDVAAIYTVAGVLDPNAWATYHDVSPFDLGQAGGFRQKISHIKQQHICGTDDDITPCLLAEQFMRSMPGANLHKVKGYNHTSDWDVIWPQILARG